MRKKKFTINLLPQAREQIIKELKAGKKVSFTKIGYFELRKIPARTFKHNFSGEVITVKAHYRVRFVPSSILKKALSKIK